VSIQRMADQPKRLLLTTVEPGRSPVTEIAQQLRIRPRPASCPHRITVQPRVHRRKYRRNSKRPNFNSRPNQL
jgi:hypothetical protein